MEGRRPNFNSTAARASKSLGSYGEATLPPKTYGTISERLSCFHPPIRWFRHLWCTMAESSSSSGSNASIGSVKKALIGLGVLGAVGAAVAFVMLGSKKQTRHLTPDVEIIDKL